MRRFHLLTLLLLLLLLVSQNFLSAQEQSEPSAYDLFERVRQTELLTPGGQDWLLERLRNDPLPTSQELGTKVQGGTVGPKTHLLSLIGQAMRKDRFFRIGATGTKARAYLSDPNQDFSTSPDTTLGRLLADSPGRQIERAIEATDSVENSWTAHPPPAPYAEDDERFTVYDYLGHEFSLFGKTRTRLNETLFRIGLTSKATHAAIKNRLTGEDLPTEMDLLAFAVKRTLTEDNINQLKGEERLLVNHLVRRELLHPEAILLSEEQPNELVDFFEFLSLGESAVRFRTDELPTDPKLAYRAVYDSLRGLVPDFDFTELRVELIKVATDETSTGLVDSGRVSFTVGEDRYAYNLAFPPNLADDPLDTVARFVPNPSMLTGINHFLADRASRYRLAFLAPADPGAEGRTEYFALRLLTQPEYNELGAASSDISLKGTGSYDNDLSPKNLRRFLGQMDSIGLLNHLSTTEQNAAETRWLDADVYSRLHVLWYYPRVMVSINYNGANLPGGRKVFLERLAAISRGQFTPTDIVDIQLRATPTAPPVDEFGFDFGGSRYGNLMLDDGPLRQPGIIKLANEALSSVGEARFHLTTYGILFLEAEQDAFFRAHYPGLIVL
ncbi:hypothetical protein [Lewinella sp. 4G2]|uniref:hypothetical protein n=1 Tax=Lewinella sp. 4G2 TaxID=1803372 RepID=UPI0007B47FD9|nr:hypothetical protein [Lewinella sp. 4G2]OAV43366.1 hypothetical protein A3850_002130 [Lewinella sp. 4G2]